MNNIYFTADSHYSHQNIVRGVSEWDNLENKSNKQSCRDFDTLEEMNDSIVNNINATVGEDDVLYHLGDWSFGGKPQIWEFRKRIRCKNIHLILGNHDVHIEHNKPYEIPNENIKIYEALATNPEISISYKSKDDEGIKLIPPHTLFKSVQRYTELSIALKDKFKPNGKQWRQKIILSHFAFRVWEKSHHGSWMLFGHSHSTLPMYGKSMDVGLDAHPEFRPYSFEEIRVIMDKRETGIVDHHNKLTN